MLIYLATGNAHKAEEFTRLLRVHDLRDIEIRPATAIGGMPHVPEDTGTFLGNARQKALALRRLAPGTAWVMSDDSGLCCAALNGAPGVETANYAYPGAPAPAHRAKLLSALHDIPESHRGAYFFCLLFLISPEGVEYVVPGSCNGSILREERGTGGFGYDPVFRAAGTDCSFAE
ncbi:MAG: hypothetical protein LBV28_00150, partial [Puniceicoccales bacterium]|nr:hypothetical protein [Puniceicoccales bacterium]